MKNHIGRGQQQQQHYSSLWATATATATAATPTPTNKAHHTKIGSTQALVETSQPLGARNVQKGACEPRPRQLPGDVGGGSASELHARFHEPDGVGERGGGKASTHTRE